MYTNGREYRGDGNGRTGGRKVFFSSLSLKFNENNMMLDNNNNERSASSEKNASFERKRVALNSRS